jgi:DNA topoisomerase-2
VFVSAQVPDPTFDSQTKSFLTTPPDAFKTRFECSDALLRAVLAKTGVAEKIAAAVAAEGDSKLKKSDGAHKTRIAGIPKLDDANWAGTKKSAECVLILTEGDSAKSTAIAGLSVVGRDRYGVFPLRGKLLNVRDATSAKIGDNEEIRCIKRILGLETGKDYSAASARAGLRYGSVLLLTDQDVDGFHIKALVFNLFDALWPSLARRPGFMRSLLTPIVKATVGSAGSAGSGGKTREVSFSSMPEYEAWSRASTASGVRWTAKYYKGLGTSTSEDARRYFRDMKCVEYVVRDAPGGPLAGPLAGGADCADGRSGVNVFANQLDKVIVMSPVCQSYQHCG